MAGGWRRHPLPFRIFSLGSRLGSYEGISSSEDGRKKQIPTYPLSPREGFQIKSYVLSPLFFLREKRNTT